MDNFSPVYLGQFSNDLFFVFHAEILIDKNTIFCFEAAEYTSGACEFLFCRVQVIMLLQSLKQTIMKKYVIMMMTAGLFLHPVRRLLSPREERESLRRGSLHSKLMGLSRN